MDFYNDKRKTYLKLINEIKPLPGFVKASPVIDQDTIPLEKFAWVEKRLFPTVDPASTYLSFAYYCLNQDKVPISVRNDLVKNAMFFGVFKDIKKFAQRYTYIKKEFIKRAKQEDIKNNYGLPNKKQYPMHDETQTYMASKHFNKHASKYTIEERQRIANNIAKKTKKYKIQPSCEVIKYSSNNKVCRTDQAGLDIAMRGYYAKADNKINAKEMYYNLGKQLIGNVEGNNTLLKTAAVLEKLDKLTGVNQYYSDVPDPYSTVFNMTIKAAQEIIDLVELDGEQYLTNDLASLPIDMYEEALGDDIKDALVNEHGSLDKNRIKDIIPTLPLDDKKILKKFVDTILIQKDVEAEL